MSYYIKYRLGKQSAKLTANAPIDGSINQITIFNKTYPAKVFFENKNKKYELLNGTFYLHVKGEKQVRELVEKIYKDFTFKYLSNTTKK